jgi:DNA polymerase-3 subunit gamma/tau
MTYVVLARKWRPKQFEEVVGQQHVGRTLRNSIAQDRVHHAYLFTGARGVGKTSTARILAKALNCAAGPTATPCYQCSSCIEISNGQSVDVFEIDGASNRGINEIRELREGARYSPSRDRFKIYIIDEVHMLTTEAFNALLKTLEEPPPHVKFIFATTEPQKIPVTILSRCQRFDFKRITQHDIVDHLALLCEQEGIKAARAGLQLIARQAAGGMRDALSLLDQVISFAGNELDEEQVIQILGVANRGHLFTICDAILRRDAQGALQALHQIYDYGYDLHQFAGELVNHMRDMMVIRVVEDASRVTDLTETEIAQVREQVASSPPELLHRLFNVMIDGVQQMGRSPYPRLVFEMTIVRLCQLEPLVGLDLLIDKLGVIEQHLSDAAPSDEDAKKKSELALPPISSRALPAQLSSAAPVQLAPPSAPEVRDAPIAAAPAPRPAAPPELKRPQPAPQAPAAPSAPTTPTAEAPAALAPPTDDPDLPDWSPEPEGAEDGAETADAVDEDALVSGDAPGWQPDFLTSAEFTADVEDEEGDDAPTSAPAPSLRGSEQDQWRALVALVRTRAAPLAATLEHAVVQRLDREEVCLVFEERYHHFINDELRLVALREAIRDALGPTTRLVLTTERGAKGLTLAQQRDAAIEAKRVELDTFTREHPIVLQAIALFAPRDMRYKSQINEE